MYAPSANSTLPTLPRGERGALRGPKQHAMQAMQLAARFLAIEPASLKVADYRGYRNAQGETDLPSPLAISVLFAGWQRACEHLATATRNDEAVEAEVVCALYGDPALRHQAYATCGGVGAGS
jgi:hypothetical protein